MAATYQTQSGDEVDFRGVLHGGSKTAVRLFADMMSPPDTRKRELYALQAAMAESGLQEGGHGK